MSSIRDILTLKYVPYALGGVPCTLRRPSALDLLELLQVSKDRPHHIYAFLAFTHLYQDGCPVISSIDDALAMDAALIIEIGKRCEQLYEEGRD